MIDADLATDHGHPDWSASTVVYPPHYGRLSPAARSAFLVWHRTGRRVREAPPTWALLHLYGLERRILVDGDDDPGLRAEAAELGSVYGTDPEVGRVAAVLTARPRASTPPTLDDGSVPDTLRIELGRRALASEPVDAPWALAWAWFHPDVARRDAAVRVPTEFARLWTVRFDEWFPDGYRPSPRRRRLVLEHVPGNPSLPSPLEVSVDDASDVFLTAGPTEVLGALTDQVSAELAPYVRWLASHPDAGGSARAAALLPPAILHGSAAQAAAQPFIDHVEARLGADDTTISDSSSLLATWAVTTGQEGAERTDSVAIAQVLERWGLGVEPDVRFGGRSLSTRSPAVLFRHDGAPVASPSEAYAAALVTVELCAAVAAADGVVDDLEEALLVDQVRRVEGLTNAERRRLEAHRVLLATSGLRLDDVAARVVGLDDDRRADIAEYLIGVAQVDGMVTDEERRTVCAVYELLGLDPAEADHRLGPGQGTDQPATVAIEEAEPDRPARGSVATDVTEPGPAVEMDAARLNDTQASNDAVRTLLGEIFADDDDPAGDLDDESQAVGATVATLDGRHSALLRELARRGRASRRELEIAAAGAGVMPDGAVDTINEAALDLADDPVIEVLDDESVEIDSAIYEEMCA